MEDDLNLGRVRRQKGKQILRRNDGGQISLCDVPPFLIGPKPVDDDKILLGSDFGFQSRHEVRADKAGTTGHNDHPLSSSVEACCRIYLRVTPLSGSVYPMPNRD